MVSPVRAMAEQGLNLDGLALETHSSPLSQVACLYSHAIESRSNKKKSHLAEGRSGAPKAPRGPQALNARSQISSSPFPAGGAHGPHILGSLLKPDASPIPQLLTLQ